MSQYTLKISQEQAKEMPMVDLAFEILKAANTPYYYRDLMQEIAKIKGLSDDEIMQVIAQVYTEINIDGRFACVGSNLWGLKRWYPVEKSEDPMGNAKRPRIINDEDDDFDDDIYAEEEEDTYAGEEEDFDRVEDEEDLFTDEDEIADEEIDEELEEEIVDEDIEDDELADEELDEEEDVSLEELEDEELLDDDDK